MDWSTLTRTPRKIEHYRRETYFREATVDVVDIFGDAASKELHDAAFLMMKPDGLIAGKLNTVYSFVTAHGFRPVAVEYVTLTRHMWRELWRYQLTAATLDRLALKDVLYAVRPSLALLLRRDGADELPGTVRLSALKGSADLRAQLPGTLRSRLRQPNRVFSLVHFADEPADLVRELGVLFPQPVRRRLLSALAARQLSAADRERLDTALAADAAGGSPLALDESIARIEAALAEVDTSAPDVGLRVVRIRAMLAAVAAGQQIDWRVLLHEASALDCPVDVWDLTVVGSYSITADEPGEPKLISNPDPATWRTAPISAEYVSLTTFPSKESARCQPSPT